VIDSVDQIARDSNPEIVHDIIMTYRCPTFCITTRVIKAYKQSVGPEYLSKLTLNKENHNDCILY